MALDHLLGYCFTRAVQTPTAMALLEETLLITYNWRHATDKSGGERQEKGIERKDTQPAVVLPEKYM